MCVCVHAHTHVPSEYRDQKTPSGLIPQTPSTLFVIVLALTHYTKLSGPQTPEVCLPLPPQYWDHKLMPCIFHVFWGLYHTTCVFHGFWGLHHLPCAFHVFWGLHDTLCIFHGSWGLHHTTCVSHGFWDLQHTPCVFHEFRGLQLMPYIFHDFWSLHHIPRIFHESWGLRHTTCILNGSWDLKHTTCVFHVFWELNFGHDTCNAKTLQTELSIPLSPAVHFKFRYLPYSTQVMNHQKSDIENPGRKGQPPAATSIAWLFHGLQERIQWNQHVGSTFLSLEKHTLVSSLILFINFILF